MKSTSDQVERLHDGRWAAGQSGDPAGHPRRKTCLTDALRDELSRAVVSDETNSLPPVWPQAAPGCNKCTVGAPPTLARTYAQRARVAARIATAQKARQRDASGVRPSVDNECARAVEFTRQVKPGRAANPGGQGADVPMCHVFPVLLPMAETPVPSRSSHGQGSTEPDKWPKSPPRGLLAYRCGSAQKKLHRFPKSARLDHKSLYRLRIEIGAEMRNDWRPGIADRLANGNGRKAD